MAGTDGLGRGPPLGHPAPTRAVCRTSFAPGTLPLEIIALGNLDLVITCLFAFYFIFLLTKYGYFFPPRGMERNEEWI